MKMNKLILAMLLIPALATVSHGKDNKTWEKRWVLAGNMLKQRSGSGAVAINDRLYIIGGIQGMEEGFLPSCEIAKIKEDGTLEDFILTSELVVPRGFIASVEYNGYVYAIGGANGPNGSTLLSSVERAKINADGTLSPWILEKNKMFSARRGGTAVVSHGYIYAIGGFNGEFLDTVERAKVLEDGSLDKWELVPQILNERRYIHGSAIAGNYIYAMGGHEKQMGGALNDVEYTYVNKKGELAEWKSTSKLLVARYLTGAISNKNYIFMIGGYNGTHTADVEFAKVNSNGSLNKWKKATPLLVGTSSMAVAAYKDHIYVIGGATRRHFTNAIQVATVNGKGELGSFQTASQTESK